MGRTITLMVRVDVEGGKRKYCVPIWIGKKNPRLRAGYVEWEKLWTMS